MNTIDLWRWKLTNPPKLNGGHVHEIIAWDFDHEVDSKGTITKLTFEPLGLLDGRGTDLLDDHSPLRRPLSIHDMACDMSGSYACETVKVADLPPSVQKRLRDLPIWS